MAPEDGRRGPQRRIKLLNAWSNVSAFVQILLGFWAKAAAQAPGWVQLMAD
jgi:hypothetical protein